MIIEYCNLKKKKKDVYDISNTCEFCGVKRLLILAYQK